MSNTGNQSLKYTRGLRRGFANSKFKRGSHSNNKATEPQIKSNDHTYKTSSQYVKDSSYNRIDKLRYRRTLKLGFGVLCCSLIITFMAYYYIEIPSIKSNNKFLTLEEKLNKELKAMNRLYQLHIDYGQQYLVNNDLELAQAEFEDAIKVYPYKKEGSLGMTKTLIKRCQFENLYCDRAAEYYDFTTSHVKLNKTELGELNKLFYNSNVNILVK